MGVKCIVQTSDAAIEEKLKQLNAEKCGRFEISCTLFVHKEKGTGQQHPQIEKELLAFTFDDSPGNVFFASCGAPKDIKGGMRPAPSPCAVFGTGKAFMPIVKNSFSAKKSISVKGTRYRIGDFILSTGAVVLGSDGSLRGHVFEAEYCPCASPMRGQGILRDFLSNFAREAPQFLEVADPRCRLPAVFSHQHLALHYVELFRQMDLVR
mmetsp:Transcript_10134/g.25368  ORF Transcript_10134/g.25368 Transcript_10134/m.25368 type:complete len:209 (-) Transcript_10134:80-706(-)